MNSSYEPLRIVRHMCTAELQHRLKYANSEEEKQALRTEIDFWQRYRHSTTG